MMRRWLRRLGYLLLLIIWLLVMAFPTFAFFLATQDEMQLGSDPRSHVRFFMVQEESSSGVGVEWVRSARQAENCTRTSLRYYFWEGNGEGKNVDFCQCFDPVSAAPLPVEESSCS